jgi:hypothetical protein
MTTIILSSYVVRSDDGSIDLDGTCTKFAGDLLKYQTEQETESETVGAAVRAAFDAHPGCKYNMPAITSAALNILNVQPENFKMLSEKVHSFIQAHAGTRESGAEFRIAKGKGGGVARWSSIPVEEPKGDK